MGDEKSLRKARLAFTLLAAILLASLAPLAPLAQGGVRVASLSLERSNATHVILGVSIEGSRVGYLAIVFFDSIDSCYSIRLDYELARDKLGSVVGFDPVDIQVLATWTLTPDPVPPWWYEDLQESGRARGFRGFIPLSTVTPPLPVTSMIVSDLKVSLVVSDGYVGGYVWVLDVSKLLNAHGFTLRYSPGLAKVRVSSVEKESGANWVIYKLLTGRRVSGTITVTGYPSFRDARVVVISFSEDPIDSKGLERFLRVYVNGFLDGESVSRVFTVKRGETLVIPDDLPADLRGKGFLDIYDLRIEVSWSTITLYTINVIDDTGIIVVDLAKVARLLEGSAKLLKVEDLGRGWVAAYIGINATLNGVDTRVKIDPAPGSVEPEFVRAIAIRNYMDHKIVFKILMYFTKPGFFEGEVSIERPDSERPGVVYKTRIPRIEVSGGPPVDRVETPLHAFYMPLSGFLESEIGEIERKLARGAGTFEDVMRLVRLRAELAVAREDQWVVLLEPGIRLRWEQWLEVSVKLVVVPSDTSRPVTLRGEVEVGRRGVDLTQNRFSYLVFGNWSGYSKLAPHPKGLTLDLGLTVGYILEELVDGSISRDNVIERVIIYIDNARGVAIAEDRVVLCTATSPARDPRVSTADLGIPETPVEPEREALEMLTAVILALIILALVSIILSFAPKLVLTLVYLAGSAPSALRILARSARRGLLNGRRKRF